MVWLVMRDVRLDREDVRNIDNIWDVGAWRELAIADDDRCGIGVADWSCIVGLLAYFVGG